MDGPVSIFLVAALNVGLACIVAFGLFRLIAGKGKASTAIDYGRKWSAWAVFTGTATTLQKFFRKLDVDSFAVWLLVAITLGIVAFVAGWFYGKYFKQGNGKSPEMKGKRTGTNSILSNSMIHVSEKAIPFNPTTQRQDKTDHTQTDIITQKTVPTIATQTLPKADLGDEAFYEKAFNELESADRKVGLWAKVFAEAQGNESLAKASYLKIRSGQLSNVSNAIETGRDGRFIAYNNGTVLDTRTNLMWAAQDNGSDITWANAKSYCENFRGGGYTDWRMPTQDELAGLYDGSVKGHYGNHLTTLITLTAGCPWASETRGSDAAYFQFRQWQQVLVSPVQRLLQPGTPGAFRQIGYLIIFFWV